MSPGRSRSAEVDQHLCQELRKSVVAHGLPPEKRSGTESITELHISGDFCTASS